MNNNSTAENENENPSSHLYDPIRREWVLVTPEEIVRQNLLDILINQLGFPPDLITVEKELRHMPHLTLQRASRMPQRRADLVCFAKGIHPGIDLYPLLLIECKAVPITPSVLRQITGYNHYVNAFFIAVVNQQEVRLGYLDPNKGGYTYTSQLLPFQALVKAASRAQAGLN